jgi:hypothetical protein
LVNFFSGDFSMPGVKTLSATFKHVVFCRYGTVEGMVVHVDGAPAQVVLGEGDKAAAALVAALREGQVLSLDVRPTQSEKQHAAAHPVWALREILKVDGAAPTAPMPLEPAPVCCGKVVRLNFSRHGEPNGYVLDTGHFVHVEPDRFADLGLGIGDRVEADGDDAMFLSTDGGWALEALTVNGRSVR